MSAAPKYVWPTHAYIAVNDAGSVRCIVNDDEFKKDTARSVADWIKRGYTVERLPMEEAKRRFTESIQADKRLQKGDSR